ncbi:LysR family transcriptional regulator [Pseudoroseomonas globiformis]|uniref:LysR family transcriptional regulator n=1 Tax=Teichococcus globiformis TaxID=2307229 RepID=A0ABV7FUN8_9PROT
MRSSARALSWDDLRLIDAVASTRNLPAAAARLDIDHSTAFRRLRAVEAALGQPLFERHRTGYALTQAGEEMAALAARVDQDMAAVTRRLAGQAAAPSGEVRLTTSDSLLAHLLLPILAEFRAAQRAIRLDLVTGNAALNLSRRDADVAVRASDNPPHTLVGRRVARIAWALYGAVARPQIPPDTDWLCLGENLAGLKVVRATQATVPPERVAARFDTVLGLAQGIEAGMGVGHLPCFSGDASPRLVRLAPPDPAHATDLWVLTHADLRHTPRIRVLMDHLAEAIGARRALIEGAAPR